jgi:hypothetical protein
LENCCILLEIFFELKPQQILLYSELYSVGVGNLEERKRDTEESLPEIRLKILKDIHA